jgi:hypothetical protein
MKHETFKDADFEKANCTHGAADRWAPAYGKLGTTGQFTDLYVSKAGRAQQDVSPRRLAAFIRADLKRLARICLESRGDLDVSAWAYATALVLNMAPRGPYTIDRSTVIRRTFPGLSLGSLDHDLKDMGLVALPADIEAAMKKAEKAQGKNIGSQYIAKILDITAAERQAAKAWNIGAIDESRTERRGADRCKRAEREKERRKKADRKADTARKQRARRAAGVKPRKEYEANSLSQTRPWEAKGISRRTWERRKAKATPAESNQVSSSGVASVSVSQVCPCPTHTIVSSMGDHPSDYVPTSTLPPSNRSSIRGGALDPQTDAERLAEALRGVERQSGVDYRIEGVAHSGSEREVWGR